jgi:hypothetical protein
MLPTYFKDDLHTVFYIVLHNARTCIKKTSSANSSAKICCSVRVKGQQFEQAAILSVRHSDQDSSQAFAKPERMRT